MVGFRLRRVSVLAFTESAASRVWEGFFWMSGCCARRRIFLVNVAILGSEGSYVLLLLLVVVTGHDLSCRLR